MNSPSKLQIRPAVHHGQNRLLIIFEHNPEWNQRVRKLVGVRWSHSLKAWHVADNT
jgi:hypothetical protein